MQNINKIENLHANDKHIKKMMLRSVVWYVQLRPTYRYENASIYMGIYVVGTFVSTLVHYHKFL